MMPYHCRLLRKGDICARSAADHELYSVPSPVNLSHLRVNARPEEVDVLLDALRLHPHLERRRPRLEHHGKPQLAVRLNRLSGMKKSQRERWNG